jgi:enoyl-CoA hydratase
VAQAKRVIEHGADLPLKDACELERQAFALLFGTADQREGMKAFLEKRPAEFKGV